MACATDNAIVWGLGDHVLVHRAGTLSPGDHRAEAVAVRAQVLEHHGTVVRAARPMALLTPQTTADAATQDAAFAASLVS